MSAYEKLIRQFERFPGIGARQAKRFVNHLLTDSPENIAELSHLIETIHNTVGTCHQCFRFYTKERSSAQCPICSDSGRNPSLLTVVETDADMSAIERSGVYDGYYFILGGTVPLLESKEHNTVRGGALKHIIEDRIKAGLSEIILAFSINPDGENTGRYVEKLLGDAIEKHQLRISTLGRGLSTGSELEYADSETIKNAIKNRG